MRWRRGRLPTPVLLDFPVAQLVKNPPTGRETWVRSLGWEDPLGEGKGDPLQYSGLENSLDCIVHGVTKSQTWLSDFHFHFFLHSTVHLLNITWCLLLGSYLNCLYWGILQDAFKRRISWFIFLCSMKGDIYDIYITYTLCLADYFLNLW